MIDRPTSEDRFESAEFAPVRVGGGRRRSWGPVLIAGWLVVLAAVVGVGTLGRSGPSKPDQAAALARAGASPGTVATSGEVRAPDVGPARPSDPDPVGYVV